MDDKKHKNQTSPQIRFEFLGNFDLKGNFICVSSLKNVREKTENMKYFISSSSVFCLVFSLFSYAGEKKIHAKEIKSIRIKALYLELNLKKGSSENYEIKWSPSLSVSLEDDSLKIEEGGFNLKKSWNFSGSKGPVSKLTIVGPPVPLKLFAKQLNASVSQWRESVLISSFKVSLKGSRNGGSWKLRFKKGTLDLKDYKGSLFVKAFHLVNKVKVAQGHFQYHVNEGSLKVNNFKGRFEFITDKALFDLKNLEGDLKGLSTSGNVNISIKPGKVHLLSDKARVNLSFIDWSPKIRAKTKKGKIYGLNYLNKEISGKSKTLFGQIRGPLKKGEVFVQSDTGSIYIN